MNGVHGGEAATLRSRDIRIGKEKKHSGGKGNWEFFTTGEGK